MKKTKLTPDIAFFVGFWKMRPTEKGIGVKGGINIQKEFVKLVIDNKFVPPEKIKVEKNSVTFHHIKYRSEFKKIVENQNDIFNKRNRLSSAYLRGIYESTGIKKEDAVIIENANFKDQMLFERLGFYTRLKRKEKELGIINWEKFLEFIRE